MKTYIEARKQHFNEELCLMCDSFIPIFDKHKKFMTECDFQTEENEDLKEFI